jgi:DNA primase
MTLDANSPRVQLRSGERVIFPDDGVTKGDLFAYYEAKRAGVLINYNQNGAGRTTASVYSVRPKPGATVSTPVRWEEMERGLDRREFTMQVALQRAEGEGPLRAGPRRRAVAGRGVNQAGEAR